jgi:hypothetical protein
MVKQLSTVCGTAHDPLTLYDDTLVTLPCQNLIWRSPCAVTYATAATVKACPYTSHHRVKPCHLICTSDLLLFTVQVCQHVLKNSHSTAIYTVHSHWNSHETHTTLLTASEQPSPSQTTSCRQRHFIWSWCCSGACISPYRTGLVLMALACHVVPVVTAVVPHAPASLYVVI